ESAAAGIGDAPVVEVLLWRGLKTPVDLRQALRHDDGTRNIDVEAASGAARLDETYGVAWVLGQTGCQYAAGGAAAHDDKIEKRFGCSHTRSLLQKFRWMDRIHSRGCATDPLA